MSTENKKEIEHQANLELIIENAIKMPGIKVNRNEFLMKMFERENIDIHILLDEGPISAGISQERLSKLAQKLISARTTESAGISFLAGIPGGVAMAATIPADTIQFFGMTLRLAQELTYLYGGEDLWKNGNVDSDLVRTQLVLYCGVMFGVSGASSGVRVLSSQLAKQAAKKIPQQALTKTAWYPILKQICKVIGVRMTKDIAAKGISKVIPVVGGIVSGGLTFATMRPMGQNLAQTLDEASFAYTDDMMKNDVEILEQMAEKPWKSEDENEKDIFETLEKISVLRDKGIITEEEYAKKKEELIDRI